MTEIDIEEGKNMAKDTMRKIGLFGLGVLAITQEKIEEYSQELVNKGTMNREEGKQFVKDVLQEKNTQFNELMEYINNKAKECMDKNLQEGEILTKQDIEGFVTKKDIDGFVAKKDIDGITADIRKEIDELKRRTDKIDSIFRTY